MPKKIISDYDLRFDLEFFHYTDGQARNQNWVVIFVSSLDIWIIIEISSFGGLDFKVSIMPS